jgi:hypothetical protein
MRLATVNIRTVAILSVGQRVLSLKFQAEVIHPSIPIE